MKVLCDPKKQQEFLQFIELARIHTELDGMDDFNLLCQSYETFISRKEQELDVCRRENLIDIEVVSNSIHQPMGILGVNQTSQDMTKDNEEEENDNMRTWWIENQDYEHEILTDLEIVISSCDTYSDSYGGMQLDYEQESETTYPSSSHSNTSDFRNELHQEYHY